MASDDDKPRMNVARLTYAALIASETPLSSYEIQKRTGCNIKTIQAALTRFKAEDLVVKYGTADWNTKWSVKSRKCEMLPERRGKSPGSKKALKLHGGNSNPPHNFKNLKNAKLTRDGKLIPQPKPKTALEQAWGWVPSITCVSEVDDEEVAT